jgi:hypothetical protein
MLVEDFESFKNHKSVNPLNLEVYSKEKWINEYC